MPVDVDLSQLEPGNAIAALDVVTVNDSKSMFQPAARKKSKGPENGVLGTIAELEVVKILLEHGYEPYLPLPGRAAAKIDMLAINMATGEVSRIQVKSSFTDSKSIVAQLSNGIILVSVKFSRTHLKLYTEEKQEHSQEAMIEYQAKQGRLVGNFEGVE